MKMRYHFISFGAGIALGAGVILPYAQFFPEPKVETVPVYVEDEVIINNMYKTNMRITAIGEGTARVTERVKTDTTSDEPSTGWVDSFKKAVHRSVYLDRLTLEAEGDVFTGYDFRTQGILSVESNDSTVTIRIGAPKILFTDLSTDPKKTKSIKPEKGALNFADNRSLLEAAARYNAELKITAEACKKGILKLAQTSGEEIITEEQTNSLRAVGDMREVVVISKPGTCKSTLN